MDPPSSSKVKAKSKGKAGRGVDAWVCSVVGRPYDTDFEIEDDQAWELWTWPGVYKGRRMWEQPSIVRPCAVDGPNSGRHEVLNEHELTPAFPHIVPVTETVELSESGRARRGATRRQSTAPPAEEDDPPTKKDAKRKPQSRKSSTTNEPTKKQTAAQRRASASTSASVDRELTPTAGLTSVGSGPPSHEGTAASGALGEGRMTVDEPEGIEPTVSDPVYARSAGNHLPPLPEASAPPSRQTSPPPSGPSVSTLQTSQQVTTDGAGHHPTAELALEPARSTIHPPRGPNPFIPTTAVAETSTGLLNATQMASPSAPASPSLLPSTMTSKPVDAAALSASLPLGTGPPPSAEPRSDVPIEAMPSRPPNPFIRTPSGSSTPALVPPQRSQASPDVLSAPTNHVGETAYGPSILSGETPAGSPLRPATVMDDHAMDIDQPNTQVAPSAVAAPQTRLPSFKKKKDASEPIERLDKSGFAKTKDKGKGKARETSMDVPADERSSQGRSRSRGMHPPRSEDYTEGTTSEPMSMRKRKDPEDDPVGHPSSSPLTEASDADDSDDPPVVARVTSESSRPSSSKKAKKTTKSRPPGKLPSSDEDDSDASGSSEGSSAGEKRKVRTEPASAKAPKIKLRTKAESKLSTSTPSAASTSAPVSLAASPSGRDKPSAAASPSSASVGSKLSSSVSKSSVLTDVLKKSVHPPSKPTASQPPSGASTPKLGAAAGAVKQPGQPSTSAAKSKPAAKSSFLLSLVDGGASGGAKSSPAASKISSAEAKKKKEQDAEIAKMKAEYFAEVDRECSKPLDIEAQANVMRTFEMWQISNKVPRDEFLQPLSRGVGWAIADKFRERNPPGTVRKPMPYPRNAKEAEDWRFRWVEEMEGCWDEEDKVDAYLKDETRFPGGPWARR